MTNRLLDSRVVRQIRQGQGQHFGTQRARAAVPGARTKDHIATRCTFGNARRHSRTDASQTAQVASQQGKYLAKSLSTSEQSLQPFVYHHLGSLAYIGNAAVFDFGSMSFMGGLVRFISHTSLTSHGVFGRPPCMLGVPFIGQSKCRRERECCSWLTGSSGEDPSHLIVRAGSLAAVGYGGETSPFVNSLAIQTTPQLRSALQGAPNSVIEPSFCGQACPKQSCSTVR